MKIDRYKNMRTTVGNGLWKQGPFLIHRGVSLMVIVRQSFGGYEDCQKSLYSKGLTQKIVFLIQVDSKIHSKKSIR